MWNIMVQCKLVAWNLTSATEEVRGTESKESFNFFLLQAVAALMSHFWYREKFTNYPKARKAVLPFIL